MDDLEPVWIETRPADRERRSSNPYLDLIEGTKPPEIVEFELNMSPYARVLPNNSHVYAASRAPRGGGTPRRAKPLVFITSLVLLIPIIYGCVHLFLAHLGH